MVRKGNKYNSKWDLQKYKNLKNEFDIIKSGSFANPFFLGNPSPIILRNKRTPYYIDAGNLITNEAGTPIPVEAPPTFDVEFFETFATNNNTDWDGVEVFEEPFDFSGAETTFTEDFENDW
jgi:hypothetical protein